MEQNNTCNLSNCKNKPEFAVRFALRSNDSHPPAVSSPILCVCAEHMDVEWKDVCDDNGWASIQKTFKDKGLVPPEIKFSYLEIVPI